MSLSAFDGAHWDVNAWNAGPPPAPGWGDDWAWWYQVGTGGIVPLNELVVEARWTTDSHTLGDGTFRGDLQPGSLTVRLWDPGHLLDNLDKLGAVWACYKPTAQVWCWFYDQFARGLYAPGDPAAADCVFTGTQWPVRLTSSQGSLAPAVQTAAARLAAIVANLNAVTVLNLPAVTGNIAAQTQQVSAPAFSGFGYPSYLALVRDAATDGIAWLAPAATPPAAGTLVLTYARWETVKATRTLDRSQIVAGPPTTASSDWVTTAVTWSGTNAATGVQTTQGMSTPSSWQTWGYVGPSLRVYGNIASGGPELTPVQNTAVALMGDRADATEQLLSSVSLQSGTRWTADGKPSPADWDPYAHVFAPTDVAQIDDGAGHLKKYRVTKSDHRLTSTVWQTTHYLDKYTAPSPLP